MYRIHVNSNRVRSNAKNNTTDPAITVRNEKNVILAYANEVAIHGPSKVVYSPDKPLPCGARLWIETDAVVEADPVE